VLAFDSVPSDTSTDIHSDLWSTIDALPSSYTPIRSSLMIPEKASDVRGTFFEVSVKRKGQKPILFRRVESELVTCESSGCESESP